MIIQITTDHTELKRIIRKYYNHLYFNKYNNFDKTDKFFEKQNFPKWTQEENEILNGFIFTKEIEF